MAATRRPKIIRVDLQGISYHRVQIQCIHMTYLSLCTYNYERKSTPLYQALKGSYEFEEAIISAADVLNQLRRTRPADREDVCHIHFVDENMQ